MPFTRPSQDVQAVLFDYGLVLSGPPDPAAWEQMKQVLSTDENGLQNSYWRWRHDYDRGTLSGEAYWRQVASDLDRTLDAAQLHRLLQADTDLWTQPNQPMIDWAAQLQAAGMRTGILSNIGDVMEVRVLAACPWLKGFAHHTFSHRLKLAKPELAIYHHAANGLGVPVSSVLFIDDREDNIEGARAAGMQVIRYTDHAAFHVAMQQAGLADLLTPTPTPAAP